MHCPGASGEPSTTQDAAEPLSYVAYLCCTHDHMQARFPAPVAAVGITGRPVAS
jgi:hypothetical protein